MHIICLTPVEPGVYNDHKADHIKMPPEGWAYIPDDFPLPSTFPRLGSLDAEEVTYTRKVEVYKNESEPTIETQEYTVMTVVSMTEGTLPEHVEPEAKEPTMEEILNAMLGVE